MPRLKTLVKSFCFDNALRAHKCHGNSTHQIQKGDLRLKIKEGRNELHYCVECAHKIISADIAKLQKGLKNIG